MEADADRLARGSGVERVEHDSSIRVLEGHILQLRSGRFVRANANRAGQQELACLAQHIVVQLRLHPCMIRVGQVDGNQAAALVAAAHERAVVLVGGQRPKHIAPRPVAGHGDELSGLLRKDITLLPCTSARLGHPLILQRKLLMILRHDRRIAAVVMPCGTGRQGAGLRIFQHRLGVIRPVPVVVIGHDLGTQVSRSQCRPKRLAEEGSLLGCQHLHAAVSGRCVERLVLHAQRPHRHAGLLVTLNGLDKIAG